MTPNPSFPEATVTTRTTSNRTRVRVLAALLAVSLARLVLVGCARLGLAPSACDTSKAQNIGFVIGHRANAPAPQVVPAVKAIIDGAILSNGQYVIVSADGAPFVYDHNSLGALVESGESLCKEHQATSIEEFPAALAATPPVTNEADTLTALSLAARGISELPGEKLLVVIDSGLQTIAPLDLANGEALYGATPDEIAESVLVPEELKGMTVYWSGMGDTMPPQEPLTLEARQLLIDIWTAILTKAGAELVIVADPLAPVDPAVDTTVSVVDVQPVEGLPQPIQLTEDSVRFTADDYTFSEKDRARAVLAEVAARILAAPGAGLITITGTTARYDSEDVNIELSRHRAEAVKALLVEFGVPADRIVTQGYGSEWECYVPDNDAANRKVIITSGSQQPEDICR